ncbi:2-amino-4-hydroxy-6-hydroxymethyldihydropteridine diphosphokinase [Dyella sp.]|jgi:2-amino-4-hydroxy-6-hydroxymethyldihydropteridine diphosphokinase|uniref:2-amino-4-hydroxy-6- hydroxymethyldihydropteridine diphosphokinase n=1 Tax=Dyella sp. TaxID=1869338 RepID=UPI002D79B342|nr:2-amino-4-hydroxy-6-hydroxymethyldihydropteridine diphosphokinase [Dyella sp.]HET6433024.1 2-amino-4-hydroxy-6-hydroxymethyldihydropteridine diphosphokinase [Dyella sp.]
MTPAVTTDAFVALGSNLGDPRRQVLAAMDALAALPQVHVRSRSRLYRSAPWGMREQPDFINAVVALQTTLGPHDLLDALLDLERAAGRTRDGERWGPRTLDLDLLHMVGVSLSTPRLTLPHPRLAERAFVLLPLAEVAPALSIPHVGSISALVARVDSPDCVALG